MILQWSTDNRKIYWSNKECCTSLLPTSVLFATKSPVLNYNNRNSYSYVLISVLDQTLFPIWLWEELNVWRHLWVYRLVLSECFWYFTGRHVRSGGERTTDCFLCSVSSWRMIYEEGFQMQSLHNSLVNKLKSYLDALLGYYKLDPFLWSIWHILYVLHRNISKRTIVNINVRTPTTCYLFSICNPNIGQCN